MAGRFGLRSADPVRTAQSYTFASRAISGTLSAASGKGVFNSIMHLGGGPTDVGIFDNTAASGGNWQIYISGVSAGQSYVFDRVFDLGISVQLSAATRIAATFIYE